MIVKALFKNRHPKSFLIKPKFQFGVIMYVLGLGAVNFGVMYAIYQHIFQGFHATGESMGLAPQNYYFQFLNQQQETIFQYGLIALAANFLVLFVGGLVLSHRIAGPVHKIEKHAEKLAQGEAVSEISFRRKDYFPELAHAYNTVVAMVRKEKKSKKVS